MCHQTVGTQRLKRGADVAQASPKVQPTARRVSCVQASCHVLMTSPRALSTTRFPQDSPSKLESQVSHCFPNVSKCVLQYTSSCFLHVYTNLRKHFPGCRHQQVTQCRATCSISLCTQRAPPHLFRGEYRAHTVHTQSTHSAHTVHTQCTLQITVHPRNQEFKVF